MNLYHHLAPIYGQLLLALLILINSLLSTLQKRGIEKREAKRQVELAQNLEIAQRLVLEHSELLSKKIELLKHELKFNTQVNLDALNSANNFHERLEEIKREMAQSPGDPLQAPEGDDNA